MTHLGDAKSHVPDSKKLLLVNGLQIGSVDTSRVWVSSGSRNFVLTGAIFKDILPMLDGSHEAGNVVAALSPHYPSCDAWLALELLRAKQLLNPTTDLPGGDFSDLALEKIELPSPYHMYRGRFSPPEVALPSIRVSGVAETDALALAKCQNEAAERRAGFLHEGVERVTARKADLIGPALDFSELLNFSAHQYRQRALLNQSGGELDFIPRRFDESAMIDWSPARSLTTNGTCWVPTALAYYTPKSIPGTEFGVADSNGCAAGSTFDMACLAGLLELIERDACAIWWYNQLVPPVINVGAFGDSGLADLMVFASAGDRTTVLLDLTHDFGIPIVAAVSWCGEYFTAPRLGLGIAFGHEEAATKALGELVSQLAAPPAGETQTSSVTHLSPPDHVIGRRHLARSFRPMISTSQSDTENLSRVLNMLHDRNFTCMVVDQSESDSSAVVVRVIVPSLRSLASRFGPGRLFDAPSKFFKVEGKDEASMTAFGTISDMFMRHCQVD